ncbi:MAG: GNAT family N-acetyltransferase [Deltaproteobacteria bacterium]|nr:GNAT family N-acetyltransferase [Deltaproteobacteria bacterium]
MAESLPLIIRKATQNDLYEILQIEKVSFSLPWDMDTFISTLNNPRGKNIVALMGQALTFDILNHNMDLCQRTKREYQMSRPDPAEVLVGYCFAFEMRSMIHLLNLAVMPEFRRKGIGRALVGEIISLAALSNRQSIFLEVRMSNESAKCLYRSMGFRHVCTWKRYYIDTGEDADVMVKTI